MPAYFDEIEAAEEEGVTISFLSAPERILTQNGQVSGVRCIQMKLGAPDASGRRRPVPVPGSEHTIEADLVIPAIGQMPDIRSLKGIEGLDLTAMKTIKVSW